MKSFKRQELGDLTRSRSYNSFLESQQLPPLYNRPAHLPHQQSLTSLLRPSSSRSNSSRRIPRSSVGKSIPGTPDITSDECSEAAPGIGGQLNFSGPGYLRPSIVPTYEYYGFVMYLLSTVLFGLYLIWGLLGPEVLERWVGDLGYPDRWWSLAVPAWSIVALMYIYIALARYNVSILTPRLDDYRTITDAHARVCGEDQADRWVEGTDAVLDLPIGAVCYALYHHNGDEEFRVDEVAGKR